MHGNGTPAKQVIAFTGLPGTGKSTLSERLARELRTPAFAGDWMMGALTPYRILGDLDKDAFISLHDHVLETLFVRQLLLDQSAITDSVLSDETAKQWAEVAAGHGARLRVVECVCSDVELHRSRLDGRVRGIPGWHEIDWDHVERLKTWLPALTVERLRVDAVDSVEDNLRTVLDYLS
ncbi:AAA family ATPase [Glycomyces sp. NPDC047010]|uniref:AAA family ATPase n=1 Tax=Glycomyces sp. NPDC047010 TaxID=3155023 RepID=UPI0033FFA004